MNLFSQTLMTIVNGEIQQMFSQERISRDDYYERIYTKTAAMFVLATEAAATLGGANEASLDASREYGRGVGMAYQIVDDVLDFVSSPEHIGKPVGSDLRQGLITLPAIYYFEAYPNGPDVQALLSKQTENRDVISEIIAAIRRSDAIAKAMQEAREFATYAQLALEKLPDSVYVTVLSELGNYIVNRNL
jgi:geranylgeranyl pyrophosphate synthase